MLNVGKIEEGIVLDHIEAGKAMLIYHYLHLDREDYQVAIIKNARSNELGRKDILKVECDPDALNLDAVAFIDPEITVNVIKGGVIVEKKKNDHAQGDQGRAQMSQSPLHLLHRAGAAPHLLPRRSQKEDLSLQIL